MVKIIGQKRTKEVVAVNSYTFASSVIVLLTYPMLCWQICTKQVVQNIYTWVMWLLLDFVALASVVYQGGNSAILTAYTLGTIATVFSIVCVGSDSKWTWFENSVVGMAVLCMIVWSVSGAEMATVASSLALFVVGLPQLCDAWKMPHKMPLGVMFFYFVANALSVVGGADWSVKERFYPCVALFATFLYIYAIGRRYWMPVAED